MRTNRTLNLTVGTTKKSTDARSLAWFSRKARQVGEGGFFLRTIYMFRFFARPVLNAMDCHARHRLQDPEALVLASGVTPGARALEIRCGSGFFTPALAALVGPDGAVEAVDKQPLAVEATEAKVRALGLQNVHVSVADAHGTAFPEASFDAALLYGVVPGPGIIDQHRLAHELRRLLAPGGLLAV